MAEEKAVARSSWDTDIGLPDDLDAWIKNPYFGYKKEYAAKAGEGGGLQFIIPLIEEVGAEELHAAAYSVGSGWVVLDSGAKVKHPTRARFVKSSMYGRLIDRVVRELHVSMDGRGSPMEAQSWDRLGFHWVQEEHETVGGKKASQLMPVAFLGELAVDSENKALASIDTEVTKKLTELARAGSTRAGFVREAMKIKEVAINDALLAHVLDPGPEGFYAKATVKA